MNETRENEELEIDLKDLFQALISRAGTIILCGVLLAIVAFIVTQMFITPKYQSTTSFYLMSRENDNQITSSDLSVSTTLTSDVEVLITGRNVLERAIGLAGLDKSYTELADQITVNNPSDTRILEISVLDEDPYTAKIIADAIAEVSATQIVELMGVEQVNIIDHGNIAEKPTSPSIIKNTTIGAAAGAMIAIIVLVLLYILDDTIRTTDDIEQYLTASVLGVIPMSDFRNAKQSISRQRKKA